MVDTGVEKESIILGQISVTFKTKWRRMARCTHGQSSKHSSRVYSKIDGTQVVTDQSVNVKCTRSVFRFTAWSAQGIQQSTQHLWHNPQGILQNPRGLQQSPQGVQQSHQGILQNPQGLQQSPQGVQQSPQGVHPLGFCVVNRMKTMYPWY